METKIYSQTSGGIQIHGAMMKKQEGVRLLRKPRAPREPEPPPPPAKVLQKQQSQSISLMTLESSDILSHMSPVPSGAPSLLSPPPSEVHPVSMDNITQHPSWQSTNSRHTLKSHKGAPFKKGDLKYMLDPLYREKTSIGTYVEGQTLVRPYKPRGPDPLPTRHPKQHPHILSIFLDEDMLEYYNPPAFTLQDFLIRIANHRKVPVLKVKQSILSKHNYKKLQKLLAQEFLPKSSSVAQINMKPDELGVPKAAARIPQRQLLIEMAALVKEQMSGVMQTEVKSMIRPLPRYSPDYKPGFSAPHTEIVLYEDDADDREAQMLKLRQESEIPGKDTIFHASTARYFQGSRRSNSPFAPAEDEMISPSELAVLDSMMSGGSALSLKAHFISSLPDIGPVSKTITYLNISFNDFKFVPFEIFSIQQLSVLKMRNNPLRQIPEEISHLTQLKTLVFSFCLVSELPVSLFTLRKLEHLDVSYNKISHIQNNIKFLTRLRALNLEGNCLAAMPKGCVKLDHLKYVRVSNNFMHPLLWKESAQNDPQRLADIASLTLMTRGNMNIYANLPDNVRARLERFEKCDTCNGPRYGPGLKVIRPVEKIFGIKLLPILFYSCSPTCLHAFKNNTETVADILYGED